MNTTKGNITFYVDAGSNPVLRTKKINNMKQTAVEWLKDQIKDYDYSNNDGMYFFKIPFYMFQEKIEQAKQMEKEQIMNAWMATDNELQRMAAEEYYNETYKHNNK